ncbi:MAG: hypothetical protein AB7R90_10430 [Reyranellaceae bacterium]
MLKSETENTRNTKCGHAPAVAALKDQVLPCDVWVEAVINVALPHVKDAGRGSEVCDYPALAVALRPKIGPVSIQEAVRAHAFLTAAVDHWAGPDMEDARYATLNCARSCLRAFIFSAKALTGIDAEARLWFFAEEIKVGCFDDALVHFAMLAVTKDMNFLSGESSNRHENEAPAHFNLWAYHNPRDGIYNPRLTTAIQ